MISIDDAYSIIIELNDRAHGEAWDSWIAADKLDEEGEYAEAEFARDEASNEQAGYFREFFEELSQEEQEAILHYAKTNQDFAMEFDVWYGIEQ